MTPLAKHFEPAHIEHECYANWEAAGYFKPQDASLPSFCIQLPPPNITGTLHMGHAFNQTIMDSLIRYHRMKGENTLWNGGTDHAGIATQMVVERQLERQGIQRLHLGRDAFIKHVWKWQAESGNTITRQMRRIGASVDWTRQYFTMDPSYSKAVTEAFVQLYEAGLIYRGKRLVNWDPVLNTAVSDLEVVSEEEEGYLWSIRYPLVKGSGSIVVATTRPETLFGDVAIMVHPEDKRYQDWIGQYVRLPLSEREIPIIADNYVDPDFGTGAVKVTPAHDFNDYIVGQRHGLEQITVFTPDAHMNDQVPLTYRGLNREAARQKVLAELKSQGLFVGAQAHKLMVPRGERSGAILEPMLTNQWFMAMNQPDAEGKSIAQRGLEAVERGEVRFVPNNWVNSYYHWFHHIQDWCLSRQLWWGHQIPAWYDEEGHIYVARSEEDAYQQSGRRPLKREEDVLDTWFSAALVPFATLGWPEKTQDFETFLPSSVLVTGFDIIFFWVARMIMMTTYFTGKVPFQCVYIHGLIRDAEGKKMSKSEGNVLDPVDLIDGIECEPLVQKRTTGLRRPETAYQVAEKTKKTFPQGIPGYGTDALRFTFSSLATLGRHINFDQKRCEGYRNFCNKLWNATRFVLMHADSLEVFSTQAQPVQDALAYSFADQWIVGQLQQSLHDITFAFNTFRFDLAAQAIYEFVWNDYCDWYIELAKVQLQTGNEAQRYTTCHTLIEVLEVILRMAHPIIPFITEALWQSLAPLIGRKTHASIMLAAYPIADLEKIDVVAHRQVTQLKDLVCAARHLRSEMNLLPARRVPLYLEGESSSLQYTIPYLLSLAKLTEVHLVDQLPDQEAPLAIVGRTRLILKVEVDKTAELARLKKETEKLETQINKIKAKLERPGYLEKAPSHLIKKDQTDLLELEAQKNQLQVQLEKHVF